MKGIGLMGLVGLSVLLTGAGWATAATAEQPVRKDMGLFYSQHCVRCHGVDGTARTAEGRKLSGQDLTEAKWRNKTTDEAMAKVILKGIFFGLAMPGFKKDLTVEEAGQLVSDVIRKSEKGRVIGPQK